MKFIYIELILTIFVSFVYCGCNSFKTSFLSINENNRVYNCTENENGQITTLEVFSSGLNETALDIIGSQTSLENLNIEASAANVDLVPLKNLKNLVEFHLIGGYDFYSKRKNTLTTSYFGNFKKLKNLYLGDYVYSQEVLDDFASLSNVEYLNFYGIVEPNVVEAIGTLKSLKSIFIYPRTSEILDFSPLHKLEKLEKLEMKCRVHKVRMTHYSFENNSLGGLKHLKTLSLYGFSFSNHTADDISNMPSIEEITFQRCSYSERPNFESFSKLNDHLRTLIFSGYYYFKSRALYEFPEITSLTKLTTLKLRSTYITELPKDIGNLKSLEHLELLGDFEEIPSSFENIKNLKYLDLSSNKIKTLPDGISAMSNLEHLDISNNDITTLPNDFNKLKKLQYLDIHSNNITTLPDDFNKFKNLEYLNLSYNENISNLNMLQNLKNIKTLYIIRIGLTEIPSSLKSLSHLEFLDLSYNKITTVDKSIGNLVNLTTLDLSNNLISSLPSSIKKLTKLLYLYGGSNSFTTIPTSIKSLKKIIHINFDYNAIETIPDFIGDMKTLKIISIDDNKITTIPNSLSKLKNLEELYLNRNQISELPNIFNNMNNLKTLELRENKLTSYPLAICEIKTLSQFSLDVTDNYLKDVPVPDCYSDIYSISNYFQKD